MSRLVWIVAGLTLLGATPGTAWSQESDSEFRSRVQRVMERYSDLRDRYKDVGGRFDSVAAFVGIADSVRNLLESYRALDERLDVDLSAASTPRVPSSCAESEECGACYEQAQRKLTNVRVTLEKMRVIGVQTKAMKDDAMAVGQSFASIPGAGLGWYAARRDIDAGWQGFVRTYDSKYQETMKSLQSALEQIGECEAEHFNQPDWYHRFGFIYHSFMAESYHPRSVLE